MPCDYDAIRRENERKYGTDIGRIGPLLLAHRYDDRSHFIYEILQNAEDALGKRKNWNGKRSIRFTLNPNSLRISHFGKPFDEADVRAICGIAESTKELTDIGRFGIGFKSVYAFTDRPEVHSGQEDFAIENYVWPVKVSDIERDPEETVIILPLRNSEDGPEIEESLKQLPLESILFLRALDEIDWSIEGGASGIYLRRESDQLSAGVRRVKVLGRCTGSADQEQDWLIFSNPITSPEGALIGYVEIAFFLSTNLKSDRPIIQTLSRSTFVVFFPTALETHLGFLIQGPYRTTPSRDNIPAKDPWNRFCVERTALLLRDALVWLRDNNYLDVHVLSCLPLKREKFKDTLLAPLFLAALDAIREEKLLPQDGGGYIAAKNACIARTHDLRELIAPQQLSELLDAQEPLGWLSGDISQDRTHELREYLIKELDVDEIRIETLLTKLTDEFLEKQTDDWIRRFYELLANQKALLSHVRNLPLVRLENGKHITAKTYQVFLPGKAKTDFPTVRGSVCDTKQSRAFLESLGLTEPDFVDDVIFNVLPRYASEQVQINQQTYAADIERILRAYRTDSESCRSRLVEALRHAFFVAAREQGESKPRMARPGDVYLATERLKKLFAGVSGVMLVDDSYSCLTGEDTRDLLEACGAVRYLRPVPDNTLSWQECAELRKQAGHAETSWRNDRITDWDLFGLKALLGALPWLAAEERRTRSRLLWEELANLEERRGKSYFAGEYTWTHYGTHRATFDTAFVRMLNKTEWVPDHDGHLQRPELVLFESLGWQPNPFLQSKIRFKPPVIEQLEREAGFEPGMLDLLKKSGIRSVAQLRKLLGNEGQESKHDHKAGGVEEALAKLGIHCTPTPPVPKPGDENLVTLGRGVGGDGRGTGAGLGRERGFGHDHDNSGDCRHQGSGTAKCTTGATGGRPFISYVGVHPDEGPDPEGLDQAARMALEEKAISLILSQEPQWKRMPDGYPGFDLYEGDEPGAATRWCEVKAMNGGLADRPVCLSRTQFDCAREHGADYWLYVVEHAGTEKARIVRIQDPAGKARTFIFDKAWLEIAEITPALEKQEVEK